MFWLRGWYMNHRGGGHHGMGQVSPIIGWRWNYIWHCGNTLPWWGTLEFALCWNLPMPFILTPKLGYMTVQYVTFLFDRYVGPCCCYEVCLLVILHLMNWLISQCWMSPSLHNLGVGSVDMLLHRTFANTWLTWHVWRIEDWKTQGWFSTPMLFL
jgi:hypothetical protein